MRLAWIHNQRSDEVNDTRIQLLKMIFGFGLLLVLATLAIIIGLGKVEAQTSYGLDIILGGLLTLSGGFAGWAFRDLSSDKKKPDEPE